MKLSILTPTIPGRESQLARMSEKLAAQIGTLPVEHIAFSDNRRRSIGAKRQALVDAARGEYIAFVDDDDDIAPDYVAELLAYIEHGADVITFRQRATYNGLESEIVFKLRAGDGVFVPGGQTQRDAWHVCAWRRELVKRCQFGESNYGEDLEWSLQARQLARTTIHIPKILHFYTHDAATTAAPEPS
jgi:glycosyltransferase involved in cell wall biosynthesis